MTEEEDDALVPHAGWMMVEQEPMEHVHHRNSQEHVLEDGDYDNPC